MIKDSFKKYVLPVAVLSGCIGVGFLSLPYVTMKAGVFVTAIYFALLVPLVLAINLMFAQISLKTPDFRRFPGFCEYHLGKWGKITAFCTGLIGYFGVLVAYLIIGGEFLATVFQPIFGGNPLIYTLIYFTAAVVLIAVGIKAIARVELVNLCLLFLAVFLIFVKGFSSVKLGNMFSGSSGGLANFFLPYGPILFSMWGIGLIPETEEMIRGDKKLMKRVITIGTMVPAIFYFLFVGLVLSITGGSTTESAFIGLKKFLGNGVMSFSIFVAAMATFVAFVVLGLTFKKVLNFDFKIKERHALIIACFTPLALFLLGLKSFIGLISFVGGVLLGVDGILILLMYRKIGGRKIFIYPLAAVFLAGVIYEIVYFVFIK